MCNITEEKDVDVKVATLVATEVVVVSSTIKREEKWTNKTSMDEVTVVEEMVVQIVKMLNVTTAKDMDTAQKIVIPRRKWKKMQI